MPEETNRDGIGGNDIHMEGAGAPEAGSTLPPMPPQGGALYPPACPYPSQPAYPLPRPPIQPPQPRDPRERRAVMAVIAACVVLAAAGMTVFILGAVLGSDGDERPASSYYHGRTVSGISLEIENPARGTTIENTDGNLTVEGYVSGGDGGAVDGAEVTISVNEELWFSGRTDAEGWFSIDVDLNNAGVNNIYIEVSHDELKASEYTYCDWAPPLEVVRESYPRADYAYLAAHPYANMSSPVRFTGTLMGVEQRPNGISYSYYLLVDVTGQDGSSAGMAVAGCGTEPVQAVGEGIEIWGYFGGKGEYQGLPVLILSAAMSGSPEPRAGG